MLKRSVINQTVRDAQAAFARHHWHLPPAPRWDVTDFGLGDFANYGLTLVNLAEEPEYCEKLMFAYRGQRTPAHTHRKEKEDIIARNGTLAIRLWPCRPGEGPAEGTFTVPVNRLPVKLKPGAVLEIAAGSRITLVPGIYHEFWPVTDDCIIGEVSTANDDLHDNFVDERVGRFPGIEEDEPPLVRLVGDPDQG